MNRMIIILCFAFAIMVLTSCKKDVPAFPTKFIWEFSLNRDGCTYYTIVNENPLTVSDGVDVNKDKCPPLGTLGFDIEDSGNVFQYIRDLQAIASKRCN